MESLGLGYIAIIAIFGLGINLCGVVKRLRERVMIMIGVAVISLMFIQMAYRIDNITSPGTEIEYSEPFVVAVEPIFLYVDASTNKNTYIKETDFYYQVMEHYDDGALLMQSYYTEDVKVYEVEKDFRVETISTKYKKYRDCDKDCWFPKLWALLGKDGELIESGIDESGEEYKIYIPKGTLAH